MALKLARAATGRHKTISMWDSFHGASLDAISIGGEAIFRSGMGPLLPGCEHVPPPDNRHCPFKCGEKCSLSCSDYVEYVLEKEGDVAAVVAETVRCAFHSTCEITGSAFEKPVIAIVRFSFWMKSPTALVELGACSPVNTMALCRTCW